MADQPAWVEEGLAAAVPLAAERNRAMGRDDAARNWGRLVCVGGRSLTPQHPRWWGRESEAYSSTWLQGRLPTSIGMPDLLASTTTDAAAVLVLADIDFDEHRSRDAAWYGSFGTAIGAFNGAPVDPGEVPQWATRGFVQQQMSEANDGAGLAPLGTDAAAVISITAIHGDVEGSVGEFADAVCDGYIEGVSTAGGQVDGDTVRAAIDLAVTLRFAVSLTEANSLGEDVYRVALEVLGRPLDEVLELWLDANEALGPIAERSLAAVGA